MWLGYLTKSDRAGRKRFAFIDSRQVLDFVGVTQRFWPAVKHPEPVVVPDSPREQLRGFFTASGDDECTGCEGPVGLTHDGHTFRLWYNGLPGPLKILPHMATASFVGRSLTCFVTGRATTRWDALRSGRPCPGRSDRPGSAAASVPRPQSRCRRSVPGLLAPGIRATCTPPS